MTLKIRKVKVTKNINSLDCPKSIAMQDWWESSQRFKSYINFIEFFTYLSPPVTLKTRSRTPKSNQLLNSSYLSLKKIQPLVQDISYIQDYDFENGTKVTKL